MGGRYYYEKEDDWGHIFLVTEVDFKGILPFPIQLWVFGSDIKPFRSDVIFGTTVLHNSRTRPLLSNAAWILEVAQCGDDVWLSICLCLLEVSSQGI